MVNLKRNVRNTGIPPILQLAVTLNIFASGGYQINVGSSKLTSMSQSQVSKILCNTLKRLEEHLCPRFIKMDENKFSFSRSYFFNKYKIPGVIGIVDGTHIPILKPNKDEHAFFNRKGFHSINTMIVGFFVLNMHVCFY